MIVWTVLLLSSLALGAICGAVIRTKWSLLAGSLLPIIGLFAVLMYNEYFVPYEGGGASMWPIALIVGGIPAAVCGLVGAVAAQKLRKQPLAGGQ